MAGAVSYTSYDYAPVDLVPVIASFDADGHIKPLYVRINGESFKIHSSWMKPSFSGTNVYHCKVIDHNCLKPLCITYHQAECTWTVPRMPDTRRFAPK